MYFMPHTNWLCRLCAPLQPHHRYGLTFLVLITLWCAWYYGIYRTVAQTITSNTYVIQHSTAHQHAGGEETEATLKAAIAQARTALYAYNNAWKTHGVEIIFGYISQAGLHFVSSDIVTKHHASSCVKDSITLHAIGTLKQCSHFFSLVAASDVHCAYEQIDITATDNNLYKLACVITVLTAA